MVGVVFHLRDQRTSLTIDGIASMNHFTYPSIDGKVIYIFLSTHYIDSRRSKDPGEDILQNDIPQSNLVS